MLDFDDDPAFAHDLLVYCADVAIAYAPAQIAAGADTIGMSDAAAGLIGPTRYEQFVLARAAACWKRCETGTPPCSAGSTCAGAPTGSFPAWPNCPWTSMRSISPPICRLARDQAGPTRVLAGNVSTITDLLQGTPEQVYEACRRCHAVAAVTSSSARAVKSRPSPPPENLRAMMAYARDHRPEDGVKA